MPKQFKRIVFSTNSAKTIGYLYGKKINLDPYLILYTERSKCIINLNVNSKTKTPRKKQEKIILTLEQTNFF